MKPTKFGIGQPVRRVEDQRFVTGPAATAPTSCRQAIRRIFPALAARQCTRINGVDAGAARKNAGVKLVPHCGGRFAPRAIAVPRADAECRRQSDGDAGLSLCWRATGSGMWATPSP